MLVLSRKLGESIVIDDEIVLKITQVQGTRVKISLEAPRSRRILRGEIAVPPLQGVRDEETGGRREASAPQLASAN